MTHHVRISDIVAEAGTLLSLPDICLQLKHLVDSDESSANDIADLIGKDPALTARLLKIVNSSLYSFPRQISSVSQAITLIGTQSLYKLSLGTAAASIIRAAGGSSLEMKTLWKRAVYTGILAQCIVHHHRLQSDTAFISGLLCDIGVLAIIRSHPEIAMSAVGYKMKNQYPWQREKEVLGYSLAKVSGALLDEWNLPAEIIEPIRFQHEPILAMGYQQDCCVLHMATRLASDVLQDELQDGLDYRATIEYDACQVLALEPEDIDVIIEWTRDIAPEMLQILTF